MKVTDEVYREYSQMVYKYLFSLTGDAHVAEEVTQETFYQAVRCAGRFLEAAVSLPGFVLLRRIN